MKALKIEGKDSQLQVNTETIIDSASRVKGGNVAEALMQWQRQQRLAHWTSSAACACRHAGAAPG